MRCQRQERAFMNRVFESIGRGIARYLDKPAAGYEPFTPTDPAALHATIRKGDVLLVEGNSHVSGVIKYLTQSTWSHAALYVGSLASMETGEEQPDMLLEASLEQESRPFLCRSIFSSAPGFAVPLTYRSTTATSYASTQSLALAATTI
jgi:hypothetical protein